MRTVVTKRFAAAFIALAIPVTAAPAAHAAPEAQPTKPSAPIDAKDWQETLVKEAHDLEASNIPRHKVTRDGQDFFIYKLNTGMDLAIPASLTSPTP